jgi:RNA recognition motif-containing protein
LNHASAKASGGGAFATREFSVWVSDLTEDITEQDLQKTFVTRFDSVKAAKSELEILD